MDAMQVRNEITRKPTKAVSTITDSRDRRRGLRFALFDRTGQSVLLIVKPGFEANLQAEFFKVDESSGC